MTITSALLYLQTSVPVNIIMHGAHSWRLSTSSFGLEVFAVSFQGAIYDRVVVDMLCVVSQAMCCEK